jgi:hypothetical protein
MYNDGITGEYLVVTSSNATYVYQKPVGSTAIFSSTPAQTIGIGGSSLAVGFNGTLAIGGGGAVSIYQQAQDSFGTPQGLPFNPTGSVTSGGSDVNPASFGRTVSYDAASNVLSACGDHVCIFFGREGDSGWVQLGSPFQNVNADALQDISGGFGYLLSKNNFGPSSLNRFNYSGSFTSFFWSLQQQISPPSGTFGGFALAVDRFYAGVLSSTGTVQTYSNNNLAGGSGPWHTWTNLQLTAPAASTAFGTAVATSGDYVLVTDPGASGGAKVYQYQINHQQMGFPNTSTDSVTAIGSTPVFGTVIDLDAVCGAIGESSTNTVALFPVNNPLPNLCCDGSGPCPATTSACSASNAVTVSIPTVGGGNMATLTIDPNCSDYETALINFSSQTCAKVSFSGELLGPATVCFPLPSGGTQQFVSRCDPLVTLCTGQGATVQHNSQGAPFCCTPLGGTVNGNEFCTTTSTFSSFAASASWRDTDGDQIPDISDNCPLISNSFQQDQDKDLIGDVCDNCPAVPNQNQLRTTSASAGDACNCALPGVKVGPTGQPCAGIPAPALPPTGSVVLGGLLLGLGTFAAGGGRRAFRRFA